MRVLAISGPSGCGKSTLAIALQHVLRAEGWNVTLLHADSYFVGPKPESYWTQENKDHPGAINLVAVRTDVAASRENLESRKSLVILEGFMILQDSPIMEHVDAVLFLSAPPEICLQRRLNRSERTAHEREGLKHYYAKCVMPGYLNYTEPALERLRQSAGIEGATPLRELDATMPVWSVAEDAIAALRSFSGSFEDASARAAAARG